VSSVVSEIWVFEDGQRLCARLRSNADAPTLRRRLRSAGLDELLQGLETFLDVTHLNGGSSYLLAFLPGADRQDAVRRLELLAQGTGPHTPPGGEGNG
jgi:hypothetical protein